MSLVNTNQAVQDLFGIEGSESLRSKANSYLRNGVIPSSAVVEEGFRDKSLDKRAKKWLKPQAVDCLFNALVLDAFFDDTQYVKAIFESSSKRAVSATSCEEILLQAQGVRTAIHLSDVAQQFLSQLRDDSLNLRKSRLTCPFAAQRLPQMDMAMQNTGLLYQLLRAQRLSLSHKENLLLYWCEQDLVAAIQLVEQLDLAILQSDTALAELVQRIRKEYQEAQNFNALLNWLPD